jgi:hypothetical protein
LNNWQVAKEDPPNPPCKGGENSTLLSSSSLPNTRKTSPLEIKKGRKMNAVALTTMMMIGQCGPNGCPTPSRQFQLQPNLNVGSPCGPNGCSAIKQNYKWVQVPNVTQYALYRDNVQIGNYDYESKMYCPFRGNSEWGEPTEPPTSPPATPATTKKVDVGVKLGQITGSTIDENGIQNFGILPDPNPGQDPEPRYQVNGKEATKSQVIQAFEGQAVDQSTKLRLTVIGPRQSRQAVLEDVKRTPDLQSVVSNFLLKDYDPTDWEVSRSGFYTQGSPTIYVQAPTGKVLHRQDSYTGAEDLASVLRKANDQYKAEADPNLSKAAVFGLFGLPLEAWVVIAIVLYFIIPRKDGGQ